MPSAYEDFLAGVHSASWLGPTRARLRAAATGEDGGETLLGESEPVPKLELELKLDSLTSLAKAYPTPVVDGTAVAADVVWTPARIAGVVVGGTLSLGAVGLGAALVAGAIVLTVAAASTDVPQPSPPPPSPPLHPPAPAAPPGAVVTAISACVFVIDGIPVDFTHNGICEDGGDGSVDSFCSLGSDAPDCPPRFSYDPPSPPSP
ncbi:MAG: hypothetical protein ACKVI4_17085, partial [Actinomycetales bacterium]